MTPQKPPSPRIETRPIFRPMDKRQKPPGQQSDGFRSQWMNLAREYFSPYAPRR